MCRILCEDVLGYIPRLRHGGRLAYFMRPILALIQVKVGWAVLLLLFLGPGFFVQKGLEKLGFQWVALIGALLSPFVPAALWFAFSYSRYDRVPPSEDMGSLVYDSLSELNSHARLLASHGIEVGHLELTSIDELDARIRELLRRI